MCNRFSINNSFKNLWTTLHLPPKDSSTFHVCYNIVPGENVPIIHFQENQAKVTLMKWGLIPQLHSLENKVRFINAESENIHHKSFFRNLIIQNRCLIPMSGFYEWDHKTVPHQPYYFYLPYRKLFAIAGIWNATEIKGEVVYTFAVLTTQANFNVGCVHNRMPIIITPADHQRWLEDASFTINNLALPPPLYFYKISPKINDPHINEISLIHPLT